MMNRLRMILCGCVLAAALSAQGTASDDKIYDLVRIRLAQDVQVNGGALDVRVADGVVTLAGKIRTDKAKLREPSRAVRLLVMVRGWFDEAEAVDEREYDKMVLDAAKE